MKSIKFYHDAMQMGLKLFAILHVQKCTSESSLVLVYAWDNIDL